MIVIMQAPRAVATRSVGEKLSPRPWLSTGASVTSVVPEGPWVARQRSPPSYVVVIFTMVCVGLLGRGRCPVAARSTPGGDIILGPLFRPFPELLAALINQNAVTLKSLQKR